MCRHMGNFFADLVSYNRFVELQKKVIQPIAVYLKLHGFGTCSGIYFIDLTAFKLVITKKRNSIRGLKGLQKKVMEH